MTQVHHLKTLPKYFDLAWTRHKQFELRKNDRDYHLGDSVVLHEWDPHEGYYNRTISAYISCIIDSEEYLQKGYVALGLTQMVNHES